MITDRRLRHYPMVSIVLFGLMAAGAAYDVAANYELKSPGPASEPWEPNDHYGEAAKAVKVFILAGQSNMEGHGIIAADPKRNGGKGSLEYQANMANFIRDIRKDLGVDRLPFVIAETGMSGPEETHPRALSLMKAQAAVAEQPNFKGNVTSHESRYPRNSLKLLESKKDRVQHVSANRNR